MDVVATPFTQFRSRRRLFGGQVRSSKPHKVRVRVGRLVAAETDERRRTIRPTNTHHHTDTLFLLLFYAPSPIACRAHWPTTRPRACRGCSRRAPSPSKVRACVRVGWALGFVWDRSVPRLFAQSNCSMGAWLLPCRRGRGRYPQHRGGQAAGAHREQLARPQRYVVGRFG